MNNFFNWLIDLFSHNKFTALEKENAAIMDTNIMLLERVEELTRENKTLTKENQRLKNELMGARIWKDFTEGVWADKKKKPTTWDSVERYAEYLRKNPAPERFPDVNYFIAELEKSIKDRGINPEDVQEWQEMKARSEEPQEIKTEAAIIGDSIHHISITPEEYSQITSQIDYNQAAQFTTMELAKRQLCIKQQGQE